MEAGARILRNGFSMTLCDCPYRQCFKHPRIRIKSAGRHKQFIVFQHSSPPNGSREACKTEEEQGCDWMGVSSIWRS